MWDTLEFLAHRLASAEICRLTQSCNDVIGYVACALVLATFSMKSMRWLRLTAIARNLAFIIYAAVTGMLPSSSCTVRSCRFTSDV